MFLRVLIMRRIDAASPGSMFPEARPKPARTPAVLLTQVKMQRRRIVSRGMTTPIIRLKSLVMHATVSIMRTATAWRIAFVCLVAAVPRKAKAKRNVLRFAAQNNQDSEGKTPGRTKCIPVFSIVRLRCYFIGL